MHDHSAAEASTTEGFPPHPGSQEMPRWDGGELPEAPIFSWRNVTSMVGPGLVMASAAIGGGEWLTGPVVTCRYGGGLLWLAAISILVQVVYNVEISRYTLYTGEPIFTGKFRTLPGPRFWLFVYLILDFGSFLPYLASSTAVPVSAIWLGQLPDKDNASHNQLKLVLSCLIFLVALLPLMFGGKVYDSIKRIMTFKLIFVGGFLIFLALLYSRPDTWVEIFGGFFKVGNVPVVAINDLNGDGVLDAADSIRGNNIQNIFVSLFQGKGLPTIDLAWIGFLTSMIAISGNGGLTNTPISTFTREQGWGMGKHVGGIPSIVGGQAIELSHTGMVFPINAESLRRWKQWVRHVSREQFGVWAPACFVGLALPSMLSVQFLPSDKPLKIGDANLAAAMTANGVAETVAGKVTADTADLDSRNALIGVNAKLRPWPNYIVWFITLFCGVLVLGTSMASTADGVLRRWIDVFWTGLPSLREWETKHISTVYFAVLMVYASVGLTMLLSVDSTHLLVWSGIIYNYALGFSCIHVIFIIKRLMPRELHPPISRFIVLGLGGFFFTFMAIISTLGTLQEKGFIKWFG